MSVLRTLKLKYNKACVFTTLACLEPLLERALFSLLTRFLRVPHTLPQPGRRLKACRDMWVGAGPRPSLGGAELAFGVPADLGVLQDQELPDKTCLPTLGLDPLWAIPVG